MMLPYNSTGPNSLSLAYQVGGAGNSGLNFTSLSLGDGTTNYLFIAYKGGDDGKNDGGGYKLGTAPKGTWGWGETGQPGTRSYLRAITSIDSNTSIHFFNGGDGGNGAHTKHTNGFGAALVVNYITKSIYNTSSLILSTSFPVFGVSAGGGGGGGYTYLISSQPTMGTLQGAIGGNGKIIIYYP